MEIKEYKKAVDRTGRAQLTLTNKKEWSYFVGNADRVVHLNSGKLKFRWNLQRAIDWYKYTHAILHVDNKVYTVYEVGGLHIAPDTGRFELVFDYDA